MLAAGRSRVSIAVSAYQSGAGDNDLAHVSACRAVKAEDGGQPRHLRCSGEPLDRRLAREGHFQPRNLLGLDRDSALNKPAHVIGEAFLPQNETTASFRLLFHCNDEPISIV